MRLGGGWNWLRSCEIVGIAISSVEPLCSAARHFVGQ